MTNTATRPENLDRFLANPEIRKAVKRTVDRYVDIVGANETGEAVVNAVRSGNGREIVLELDEVSGDPVAEGDARPSWISVSDELSDLWLDALEEHLDEIVHRVAPTVWDKVGDLVGSINAETVHQQGPDSLQIYVDDRGYLVFTRDGAENRYLLGIYTRPGWEECDEDGMTYVDVDDSRDNVRKIVEELNRENPEGTSWYEWALQRLRDLSSDGDVKLDDVALETTETLQAGDEDYDVLEPMVDPDPVTEATRNVRSFLDRYDDSQTTWIAMSFDADDEIPLRTTDLRILLDYLGSAR